LKQFLLISALVLLYTGSRAQAPNIVYGSTTNNLTVGSAFSITPTNSGGGAVPATVYGQVSTLAGSPPLGYFNASGTNAKFNIPYTAVGDAAGNLYVADASNNAIRKVTPLGVVTTFAGSLAGTPGFNDATGTAALFDNPQGIAMDASGNLFVGDYDNDAIREITPLGVVSTFYQGATGIFGPTGICFDNSGNLIVAAQDANQICSISPTGVLTIIAGSPGRLVGNVNGTGAAARFNLPEDVQVDASGNVYVADYLNNAIRKITPAGVVSTFAGSTTTNNIGGFADGVGTAAIFNNPTGIAFNSGGVMYVADLVNNDIRRIMPDGTVKLVAGSATQAPGLVNGTGTAALFIHPVDLYIDPTGNGYIADARNGAIRKIILTGYTISGTLPAGLNFDSTTGKISGIPTAPFTPTTYTVTAFNAVGYSSTTITLTDYNYWKGINTDWTNTSNWSLNTVPGATDVVQIGVNPYTGTAQPTVGASTSVGSIEFGPNVTGNAPVLTINSNQILTVGSGIQVDAASTVGINGPGNINITGASVINGSLTAALNSVITLGNSSTLTNNGTFTLASDINGSASIAAIPSGSSVNGQVSVQRYISGGQGRRGYRLTSSPVFTATASGNNIYTVNYLINSVFVLGSGGTAGGFDNTGNPTIFLFRENMTPGYTTFTNSNYRGISAINGSPNYTIDGGAAVGDPGNFNIPVGNGFMFFFRGDRNTVNPFVSTTIPNPATLTAIGTLNQGNITVKDWFTPGSGTLSYTASSPLGIAGFNLVGNPYPSSIDWDKLGTGIIGSPGVTTFITELLPNGNYATYTAGLGAAGASDPLASNIIPSGQAFFVQVSGTGATLTFTEGAKTSTQIANPSTNLLMSTAATAPKTNNQYLRLQMALDTFYNENILISFNNAAKTTFDPKVDALYRMGFGKVSLSSLSSDHVQLAINQQSLPNLQARAIGLNVAASASGAYHLNMKDMVGVPQLFDVWLMDNYKKDSVNMRVNNIYNFNVDNSDTSSFGAKRFNLVIKQNPAYAYRLLDFNADKVAAAHQVNVVWKTQYEEDYTNFTVERSVDGGKTFNVLGGVTADGQGSYSFLDKSPVNGQDLYRLKQEDINNTISYSKVVGIFYSDLSNNISSKISIYPNPTNSNINVAFASENTESSIYNIRFMSSTGLVVKEITSSQPSWQGTISNLQPGTYIVRVVNNKTQSLVGENKFVKL
jgi:trimeric autotransporter adhesin